MTTGQQNNTSQDAVFNDIIRDIIRYHDKNKDEQIETKAIIYSILDTITGLIASQANYHQTKYIIV